jgi:pimeloyl-ACP methyl ester carboxylesterase
MQAFKAKRLIFLHGSDSSSQTYKATLLRRLYPDIIVPDFTGPLEERMKRLEEILGDANGWTIIGSSLGGTMAALFAARHPDQVRKLVLLAPALSLPEFAQEVKARISIPCIIIQGTKDGVVPLEETRKTTNKVFQNLKIIVVEDDHRLHRTAEELDWEKILIKE